MKLLKKFNQVRIATYLGTTGQNLSDFKSRNLDSYNALILGVLVYLHNMNADQLGFMIYKQQIKKSQMKVRQILGFKRNIQLTKENINIDEKAHLPEDLKHLQDLKFRMKYFQILGAIAMIAGITSENIEEHSESTEHREPPIYADDLPVLSDWKGTAIERAKEEG